jgi:hypothetical protein
MMSRSLLMGDRSSLHSRFANRAQHIYLSEFCNALVWPCDSEGVKSTQGRKPLIFFLLSTHASRLGVFSPQS